MEFTKTKRGQKKIILNGFSYVLDRTRNDKSYWRCAERGKCGSRLTLTGSDISREPSAHSHPPSNGKLSALKTLNAIKEKAEDSQECTSSIIIQCTETFPLNDAKCLPKHESLKRTVRRQRAPPDGENITEEMRKTTRGEDFVYSISSEITLLTTKGNLSLLASKPHWLGDGTFDTAPTGSQLYTVHALVDEFHTVPLVYCIMQRRTSESYEKVFNELKRLEPELDPQSFTIDYEQSAIASIKHIFPDVEVSGCFFHFGKCLYKAIQRIGLQNWYADSHNSKIIKSFQALAFVPVQDVVGAYQELVSSLTEEMVQTLTPFIGYFESTWIGIEINGRRRNPLFPLNMWNVHSRTVRDLPRTTNSLEGWHRAFEQRVNITHPTLARLVGKIKKEQARWELQIEQMKSGIAIGRRDPRYIELNTAIKDVLNTVQNTPTIEFLATLASLI